LKLETDTSQETAKRREFLVNQDLSCCPWGGISLLDNGEGRKCSNTIFTEDHIGSIVPLEEMGNNFYKCVKLRRLVSFPITLSPDSRKIGDRFCSRPKAKRKSVFKVEFLTHQ
jgi:hypothetical protein